MITVRIKFYDKKTEFIADELKADIPDEIVFRIVEKENAQERENISYINSRPFDVSDEMKSYIIGQYPEAVEKFEKYLTGFIGRHGLGPEYD